MKNLLKVLILLVMALCTFIFVACDEPNTNEQLQEHRKNDILSSDSGIPLRCKANAK